MGLRARLGSGVQSTSENDGLPADEAIWAVLQCLAGSSSAWGRSGSWDPARGWRPEQVMC